jgi:type IV secretion system protein VirB6
MTFFTDFFALIDITLQEYLTNHVTGVMAYVAPVAQTSAILLVTGIGIFMAMGWTDAPARKMLMALATIVFVIEFATNLGVYNQFVANFFTQLPDDMMGLVSNYSEASGVGETLDGFGDQILAGVDKIWQSSTGFISGVQAATVCIVVYFIWILMSVAVTIAMIIAKVALTLLVAIGPLFILLFMLPQTRDYFGKWLGYTIQYVILALLVGGVLSIVTDIVEVYFRVFGRDTTGVDFFELAPPVLIMVVLLKMFTELPSIASSLSGGIGLGIGNAAGRGFDKASSALTAPARKVTQRVVGERLDAKRQARQTLRTAGERQKLRAKQKK